MFDVDTWRQDRDAAELQSGSLPADQRRLADPSTESARKNVEKEKQQYMSQICEVILSQISKKKRLISGNGGQGGRSDPKKLLQNFGIGPHMSSTKHTALSNVDDMKSQRAKKGKVSKQLGSCPPRSLHRIRTLI